MAAAVGKKHNLFQKQKRPLKRVAAFLNIPLSYLQTYHLPHYIPKLGRRPY